MKCLAASVSLFHETVRCTHVTLLLKKNVKRSNILIMHLIIYCNYHSTVLNDEDKAFDGQLQVLGFWNIVGISFDLYARKGQW